MTEKERKFVLKRLPALKWTKTEHISQFYLDGFRYRSTLDIHEDKFKYEKVRKVKVAVGHNEELDLEELDFTAYSEAIKKAESSISKDRYTYEYNGKKFEIDRFYKLSLVMMEVENVELDTIIDFPPEIAAVLLMEVTGNEKFDNKNLSQ